MVDVCWWFKMDGHSNSNRYRVESGWVSFLAFCLSPGEEQLIHFHRPQFPGAVGSPLTASMTFLQPTVLPPIPTFRIMNTDGDIIDETRPPLDVTDEQVLTWYRNMLTGQCSAWK